MKFLKQAAVVLIFALHLAAQAQPSDLKIFLQKFETYAKTHYPKVKWTMPIAQPESSSYAMPEATREKVFMEDLQT
ncbi:MAG: hypothetical protein JWQ14_2110, partial [Adhaeribacter sp.]|nr:hypothetical protein [Adhaeribacter sp.]